ncbi:MAG: phenylalanine--tRNA ligase beta subunit-related protein [Bacteroidota bacterium]
MKLEDITIEDSIRKACPALRLGCISCAVQVQEASEELWTYIQSVIETQLPLSAPAALGQVPTIRSTRLAYKALGKEPSRYRPSAEALRRRIAQGKGLYRINNVVDLLNLVSVQSGFSIGGYDQDCIEGSVRLGVGRTGEPYEAIGRGPLNIEFLPVFRDDKGAFGTPTSDSVRTRVRVETQRFLMAIYSFEPGEPLEAAMEDAVQLLKRYAAATQIVQSIL